MPFFSCWPGPRFRWVLKRHDTSVKSLDFFIKFFFSDLINICIVVNSTDFQFHFIYLKP